MEKEKIKVIARNKIVFHDYYVLEELECGIVLKGTEIKSIRCGNVSLKESYIKVSNNSLVILNMHIALYKHGNIFNHDEVRDRILLATKKQIRKYKEKVKLEGLTLVPLSIYLKEGLCKINIGLCRGKKNYDKREDSKIKDAKRQVSSFKKISVS